MQDGDGSFNMPAFTEKVLPNYVHVFRVDAQYHWEHLLQIWWYQLSVSVVKMFITKTMATKSIKETMTQWGPQRDY